MSNPSASAARQQSGTVIHGRAPAILSFPLATLPPIPLIPANAGIQAAPAAIHAVGDHGAFVWFVSFVVKPDASRPARTPLETGAEPTRCLGPGFRRDERG